MQDERRVETKAQLLDEVCAVRDELAALLAEADGRLEEPGALDDWTLKDVVAHLTGWRLLSIARLEAAARGDEPRLPWPAELGDGDDNYQPINDWLYEHNRSRPAEDVLRESDESFGRLTAAVAALSDEALFTPGRYPWLGDYTLGPDVIAGSAGHQREEHEPALRAWLAGRN